MLHLEIASPELDLMSPIFYARRGIRIPTMSVGKLRSNRVKFEPFDMQEFQNMSLCQFHRSDIFPFLTIYIPGMFTILSGENPILSQYTSIFHSN
jgi:hypothetical protein